MNDNKNITISDVADALGVSKTTVSRAISGKGRVGGATRDRVLQYIEEHGYVPNLMAKGLAQSRTYNIGLSMPSDFALVELPFFQNCLAGICEQASGADYDVVVSMNREENITQLEKILNNRKVDGVIVTRTLARDTQIELLKKKGIPFVTVGTYDDESVVQVDNDHILACSSLTKKLIDNGAKKIALLSGDPDFMVTRCRKQGFLEAVNAATHKPEVLIFEDIAGAGMDKALKKIISEGCDSVICMDDSICVRLLDRLKKAGIKVPEDIKVASFYNSTVLERNIPSITSLNFDAREIGMIACKTLLKLVDGEDVSNKTLLGYEIAMKDSTK